MYEFGILFLQYRFGAIKKKELRESHGNMARGPEQGVFQHVLIIVC